MKSIQLTNGFVALVDDADYERCMAGPKWRAHVIYQKGGTIRTVYAERSIRNEDRSRTTQTLHRFILEVNDCKIKVDHENHNGLNNTRKNLRAGSHADNMRNRLKHSKSTSRFKGVCWDKRNSKWQAAIQVDLRTIHLGRFTSELDAAIAYDSVAREHFGEFACCNFPSKIQPNSAFVAEAAV